MLLDDSKEVDNKFKQKIEEWIIEEDKRNLDIILNKPTGYYKYPIVIIIFGKCISLPFIYKKIKYDFSKQNRYCKDNNIKCYEDLVNRGRTFELTGDVSLKDKEINNDK